MRGLIMKTATFPSLRVDPGLRQAAEEALLEGESLSSFVEESIRANIERRQVQSEFIVRGLASGNSARRTDNYIAADAVVKGLERRLAQAKAKALAGAKARSKPGARK